MSEEDSSRMYPPVYPSLNGLAHNEDSINFASANPMPVPMPTGNIPIHSQLGSLGGPANPTMQTNPLQYPAPNTSASANFMPTPTLRGNTPIHSQPGSLGGPANPTMQTNPLQYPAQNISTSSNFMDTPIHMGNPPVLLHLDASDGQEKLTRQTNPLQAPSYQNHPAPIIAIGNPGSGKSTILNALAGQVLFESGISLGCGLTEQLDVKESNGQTFIDTPGVADETYQKAAGEALTKVFHQGGRLKILFFVTQEAGRIVVQDATTMKLILESVPEIGRNYGIILNKIPSNVLSQLSDQEAFLKLILSLYAGIQDGFKNKNTLLLPLNSQLDNQNNILLRPSEIHPDLENFINTEIPEAYITPGMITEIQLDDFEQLSKQVIDLESKLKNKESQKAETEKLVIQFENMEKRKMKEYEENQKRNEEELHKMKQMIRDKEDAMRACKQRSETEIRDLKQRSEIEMRHLGQKEQEINNHKDQINKKKIAANQRKAMANRRSKDWNLIDLFGTDFGLQNTPKGANNIATGSWGY